MKLDIVFPAASAARNGIGDHTATIYHELVERGHIVRILQSGDPSEPPDYLSAWEGGQLRDTALLLEQITQNRPDAVLLQFEQFSYGTRGYNPEMARIFRSIRSSAPGVKLLLFAHESYPDPSTPKNAVMWAYQRRQLRQLAASADTVFASCEKVARRIRPATSAVRTVPIHANIAVADAERDATRTQLGIRADELAVVVFGHLEPLRARMIVAALREIGSRCAYRLVYLGRDRSALEKIGNKGPIEAVTVFDSEPADASAVLTASDLAISPFADGVTARRGTFAAFMKHGLPTVTNRGKYTDDFLLTAATIGAFELGVGPEDFAHRAGVLANDSTRRDAMRARSSHVFGFVPSVQATVDAIENAVFLLDKA